LAQAAAPPFAVDQFFARGKKAKRDLRAVAKEGLTNELAPVIGHTNNGASGHPAWFHDIAAIDPQMALAHPIGATAIN
jgi:hypothetical protein